MFPSAGRDCTSNKRERSVRAERIDFGFIFDDMLHISSISSLNPSSLLMIILGQQVKDQYRELPPPWMGLLSPFSDFVLVDLPIVCVCVCVSHF